MIYAEQGQDISELEFVNKIVKIHSSAIKDTGPSMLS